MEAVVYPLIRATLRDTFYLRQYTNNLLLIGASLNRTIAASQTILGPGNDKSTDSAKNSSHSDNESGTAQHRTTVWVGICAAGVSFTVTSLLLFGLYRHQKKRGVGPDTPTKERFARVQAKRRRYFQQLEDDPSLAAGWMVTNVNLPTCTEPQRTAVTWSVSDLTSDAESIIGSLPLDRIEEEETSKESIDEDDLEAQLSDATFRTTPTHGPMQSPLHLDHLQFIAQWSELVQHNKAMEVSAYKQQQQQHQDDEEEEAKVEDPGFFDTVDLGSDSPLGESVRLWWLEQPSAEISAVGHDVALVTPTKIYPYASEEEGESGAEGDDEGGLGETSTTLDLSDNDDEKFRGDMFDPAIIEPELPSNEFSSASFISLSVDGNDDVTVVGPTMNDSNNEDDCLLLLRANGAYQLPLTDISNTVEEDAAEMDQTAAKTSAASANSDAAKLLIAADATDHVLASWAKGVLTVLKENVQLLTYEPHQE